MNILPVAGSGTTTEKGPGNVFQVARMATMGQGRADGARNVLRVKAERVISEAC